MAACVGSASEAAQHECDWYRALTSWQVDVAPKAAEARQSMVMGVRRRRLECDRAAAKGTAVGRPGGGYLWSHVEDHIAKSRKIHLEL